MLLDASIFSRIVKNVDLSNFKKMLKYDENEIIVGRATSLTGELIRHINPKKVITAPSRFEDGSILKFLSNVDGFKVYEAPAGITFKELLQEAYKINEYPALFPFYLEGTVGGFVATNGSGFGSYKFGYVNSKIRIHELESTTVVKLSFVPYQEVIETSQEVDYAWSGIIIGNDRRFYVPKLYSQLLITTSDKSTRDTKDVINGYLNIIYREVIKQRSIPVILQTDYSFLEKTVSELNYINIAFINIVRFNSPSKRAVIYASINEDNLGNLIVYLKKNLGAVLPYPSLIEIDEFRKKLIDAYKENKLRVGKQFNKMPYIVTEASKCINCGLCLSSCASYSVTRNPLYSPLGRFNRVVKGSSLNYFYNFEPCIGCKTCENSCPEGIAISGLTEILPQYSEAKIRLEDIRVSKIPESISKNYEETLENMYKSHPIYAFFVGCSWSYDENGVISFLEFLRNEGDKTPSARVRIISGLCCGFKDYIEGNIVEAKKKVEEIERERIRLSAERVYFMCPEGYYVYTKLGGKAGIFAYDIVKDRVKGKVHIGCWMQKLGYPEGDIKECAVSYLVNYMGSIVPFSHKSEEILTVCPFATWKFGTRSVYSSLAKSKTTISITETAQSTKFDVDKALIDSAIASLILTVDSSADDIAFRISSWRLGGREYFVTLAIPIFSKYFVITFKQELSKLPQIKTYLSSISGDNITLSIKSRQIFEYINALSIDEYVMRLKEKIYNSSRLDYNSRDIVNTQEFLDSLKIIIRRSITSSTIEQVIREIAFM